MKKEPYAMMQDNDFWKNYRAEDLTKSESSMDALVKRLSNIKGI